MSDGAVSLLEVLAISIKRIKDNYADSWAVLGDMREKVQDAPEHAEAGDEVFEEVWRPQSHFYTEICVCFEGSFSMLLGENTVNLGQGDVCFILPGVQHSEMPRKDSSYMAVWIAIGKKRTALHLSGKDSITGHFYTISGCTLNSDFDYNIAINTIKSETAELTTFSTEIVKLCIMYILIMIHRNVSGSSMTDSGCVSWKDSVALQVQKYIEVNCGKTIRLNDISQEICISPNYLNTIFKSVTGRTIISFAEEYKINRARQLLEKTDWSIGAIASELGYYDQYHFSKIFKKETGDSPTQYRKAPRH